ncbi:radical SAM protein [Citrobacter portucalensis]|uniref:radical SAM/SPASM domain-containing protein n=1 Tax=Citrobacter portucalensis TaxID=1639133 RepID=UPI00237C469E|nr:radical SAM protein [Citrobacter portucalensis]MDQ9156500.1 radical SAM protein [Citrobacter portucalensis]
MIDKYCDDMCISPISTRETDGCLALNVSVTKRIIAHFPRESSALLQPITVEIHPTLHCNAKCGFCFYSSDFASKKLIPSDSLLNLAADLCQLKVKSIVISGGGEPTIHPRLHDFIDICLAGSIEIGMITNGLRINCDLMSRIEKISWVKFSMHGSNKDMHSKAFGVSGSNFKRVIENIKHLTSLVHGPIVSIGYVVNPFTVLPSDLLNFLMFGIQELKIDYVLYRPLMKVSGLVPIEVIKEFVAIEMDINKLAQNNNVFTNYSAFVRDTMASRVYTNGQCPIVTQGLICFIDGNGDFYPCLPLGQSAMEKEKNSLGNIKINRLDSLWGSERHLEWIKNMNMQRCPTCKYEKMFSYIEGIKNGEIYIKDIPNDPHVNFL